MVGGMMDYILIGRDWQKGFKFTFEAETLPKGENNVGRNGVSSINSLAKC